MSFKAQRGHLTKQVFLRVNEPLFERLAVQAERHGLKVVDLIRQMVEHCLEEMEREDARG